MNNSLLATSSQSYRDLPLRLAGFGVGERGSKHRKEGAKVLYVVSLFIFFRSADFAVLHRKE